MFEGKGSVNTTLGENEAEGDVMVYWWREKKMRNWSLNENFGRKEVCVEDG